MLGKELIRSLDKCSLSGPENCFLPTIFRHQFFPLSVIMSEGKSIFFFQFKKLFILHGYLKLLFFLSISFIILSEAVFLGGILKENHTF